MKIAIIGNGHYFNFKNKIKNYNFIIAADGGANHCFKLKIKPHLIIGDFDSIDAKVKQYYYDVPQVKIKNQNTTDLEKILKYLDKNILNKKEEKIETVDLFCVTSLNRIDHTLANFIFLYRLAKWPMRIIDKNFTLEVITKTKIIKNKKNKIVSLFPMGRTKELSLDGFKWPLTDIDVNKKNKLSISNIITKQIAKINLNKGVIILIINN